MNDAEYTKPEATPEESSGVSEYYDNYRETQEYVYKVNARKARNMLWAAATIFLLNQVIGLAIIDMLYIDLLAIPIVITAVLAGLGFYALVQPVAATLIGLVIYIAVNVWTVIELGGQAIFAGWIWKTVIIACLLAGFGNAREAMNAKKEMK